MLNWKRIGFSILCAAALCGLGQSSLHAQIKQGPPPMGIPDNQQLVGDTSALAREAQDWLVELVKINTTNPPGNEQAAAKYIADILTKEGITPELLDVAPGRSAVVARLRSSAVPDPSKALLLVAHMDVVGVDRSKWSVDPFGGVIKDGYLYGRGSIDDKSMVAANLAAFIALKRANAHLNRDVIFLATTDEEQFGEASLKILIAKYWDKFAAGYALNEGGKVVLKDGKVEYVGLQVAEKVSMNISVTVKGKGGHASMPSKQNPVAHLAAAVGKIGDYSAPVHLTSVVRRYFEGLSAIEDDETAKWMRVIDASDRGEHAQRVLSDMNPMWNSMMRDTIAPTMLQAGVRANVIPSEAKAVLNVRLLPGDTITTLLSDLNKLVNDPMVKLDLMPDAGLAAPNSSIESDFYALLTKVCAKEFGGAPVLPFLSTGATDSAQLRLHSVQAYGLRPFPMAEEDDARVHGDEERLPLSSFATGVDLTVRIVAEFSITH
ncbi:MAG TPA: M20/M25/M40 family metallo-hydrolase [Candidatus Limnocylindrales bacterium]|nr:M20/M25/M40 family metallo-hydrolase [Candidatus Limnocylindrales bacterium]